MASKRKRGCNKFFKPAKRGTRKKFFDSIDIPQGFTLEFHTGYSMGDHVSEPGPDKWTHAVLTSESEGIRVVLNVPRDGKRISRWYRDQKEPRVEGDLLTSLGSWWSSFVRTGVDCDAFNGPAVDSNAMIAEQVERARKSIALRKRMVPVPGIGFSVTPERKQECINKLKVGQSITFTPGGFGTGKRISSRRLLGFGCVEASQETCDFFGLGQLWVSEFDCD